MFTSLTGLLTYAFGFSLWERNGFILDGGDNILIISLFFLMFARTNRYLTISAAVRRLRNAVHPGHTPVLQSAQSVSAPHPSSAWMQARAIFHNAALLAIVIQVSVLYLTSALNKVQGEMWQNGVALYYILRVQEFTLPGVSAHVYEHMLPVVAMTYLTVLEQLAYPFMLLNKWTKRVSVFIVINMHLGIALLMGLVTFSAVMIILQVAAFRDDEVRDFARWLGRLIRQARCHVMGALSPRRTSGTGATQHAAR